LAVSVKSPPEIAAMRRAGRVVGKVLQTLANSIQAGMRTRELDLIAERELKALGAVSSFKGYRGYPSSLCVSINDEVVHGIPGERIIKNGDLVSLDFGAIVDGYHGDAALTVTVGEVGMRAQNLLRTTKGALEAGVAAARVGAHLGDISCAIQEYAESHGFSVVREYTGHGIGKAMHEDPLVPNFGRAGTGLELKAGMTFALEPMLTAGDWHTKVGTDNWVVFTADHSLAAHFEHTIALAATGAEVLTIPENGPTGG